MKLSTTTIHSNEICKPSTYQNNIVARKLCPAEPAILTWLWSLTGKVCTVFAMLGMCILVLSSALVALDSVGLFVFGLSEIQAFTTMLSFVCAWPYCQYKSAFTKLNWVKGNKYTCALSHIMILLLICLMLFATIKGGIYHYDYQNKSTVLLLDIWHIYTISCSAIVLVMAVNILELCKSLYAISAGLVRSQTGS